MKHRRPIVTETPDGIFVLAAGLSDPLNPFLLKVKGTGGTGENMFALLYTGANSSTGSGGTITGNPGYDYWVGTQQFHPDGGSERNPVCDLIYADGETLVSLDDGRVLKVRDTGGTGQNMFAVTETEQGFESVPGYDYLVGSCRLSSKAKLYRAGDVLFVAFSVILIKIKGNGGGGYNMFAIESEGDAITGSPGYDYWIGTQRPHDISGD